MAIKKKKKEIWLSATEVNKLLKLTNARLYRARRDGHVIGKKVGTSYMYNWYEVGPHFLHKSRTLTVEDYDKLTKLVERSGGGGRTHVVATDDPDLPDPSEGLNTMYSLSEARAKKEQFLALKAETEYNLLAGNVAKTIEISNTIATIASNAQKSFLSIADRTAALVASESKQSECHKIIFDEVRQILQEFVEELGSLHENS